jgi:ubiquinone/menaquinone biosynthesis C-methylase UbiE
MRLPLAANSFDIVYCHFFLLWVVDATQALAEMNRVARPGGWVLALAEPDYGGRIDYPPPLASAGRLQLEALRAQGAEPETGRRLAHLFHQAGLTQIRTGVLGGQWSQMDSNEWQLEWETLRRDLTGLVSPAEIERLYRLEVASRKAGERVLFVPTFYAAGVKASQIEVRSRKESGSSDGPGR